MTRTRTPAPRPPTPEVVDERAERIAAITKQVNAAAVKRNLTTKEQPLITTVAERKLLRGSPIPTGIVQLDLLLRGGLPRGLASLWWGDEGVGKSLAAGSVAATTIKAGGYVFWWVAEQSSLDAVCAIYHIDPNDPHLVVFDSRGSGEQGFEMMLDYLLDGMIPTDIFDLIVLDSLAGLDPNYNFKQEAKKDSSFSKKSDNPAVVARMYANMVRRLQSTKALGRAHFLMISQARVDVGAYGAPTGPVGGKAIKHFSRLTFKFRKVSGEGKILLKNKVQIGHTIGITIQKDGFQARLQGQSLEYRVIYEFGIDNVSSYFDIMRSIGLLENPSSGTFVTSEKVLNRMEPEHREAVASIRGEQKVRNAIGSVPGYFSAIKAEVESHLAAGGDLGVTTFDEEDIALDEEDDDPESAALAAFGPIDLESSASTLSALGEIFPGNEEIPEV